MFLLLRRVFVLLISLRFSPFPLRGYVNVRTNSQRQQRRQRSAIGRIGRRSVARRIGTTAPRRAPPPPPPTGACSSSDVALRCDVRGRVVYTGPSLLHTPLPAPGSSCCRAVDLPCATSYTSAHNTLHGHYTQTPTLPEQLPLFRSLSLAHAQTVLCACVSVYRSGFGQTFFLHTGTRGQRRLRCNIRRATGSIAFYRNSTLTN